MKAEARVAGNPPRRNRVDLVVNMRPDKELGIDDFFPEFSAAGEIAILHHPVQGDGLVRKEIHRPPDTAHTPRHQCGVRDRVTAVKNLSAGLKQFLDPDEVSRAVLDVVNTINFEELREQGGGHIKPRMNRNVIDHDRHGTGPGDGFVMRHNPSFVGTFEVGRQHHHGVHAAVYRVLGGGEGITEVDRRSLCDDRSPPVDMLCRYLDQVTLFFGAEISELSCTTTGQNDVHSGLKHPVNMGKIPRLVDPVRVLLEYGTDRHTHTAE